MWTTWICSYWVCQTQVRMWKSSPVCFLDVSPPLQVQVDQGSCALLCHLHQVGATLVDIAYCLQTDNNIIAADLFICKWDIWLDRLASSPSSSSPQTCLTSPSSQTLSGASLDFQPPSPSELQSSISTFTAIINWVSPDFWCWIWTHGRSPFLLSFCWCHSISLKRFFLGSTKMFYFVHCNLPSIVLLGVKAII